MSHIRCWPYCLWCLLPTCAGGKPLPDRSVTVPMLRVRISPKERAGSGWGQEGFRMSRLALINLSAKLRPHVERYLRDERRLRQCISTMPTSCFTHYLTSSWGHHHLHGSRLRQNTEYKSRNEGSWCKPLPNTWLARMLGSYVRSLKYPQKVL